MGCYRKPRIPRKLIGGALPRSGVYPCSIQPKKVLDSVVNVRLIENRALHDRIAEAILKESLDVVLRSEALYFRTSDND